MTDDREFAMRDLFTIEDHLQTKVRATIAAVVQLIEEASHAGIEILPEATQDRVVLRFGVLHVFFRASYGLNTTHGYVQYGHFLWGSDGLVEVPDGEWKIELHSRYPSALTERGGDRHIREAVGKVLNAIGEGGEEVRILDGAVEAAPGAKPARWSVR